MLFQSSVQAGSTTSRLCLGLIAVTLVANPARAEQRVEETSHARMGDGSLNAYVGTVSLPADGIWRIQASESEGPISELYLVPTQPSRLRQLGKRMYAALEDRQIGNGRWQVHMGFEACRQYAQDNRGIGPKSVADFEGDKRWNYLSERWNASHWRLDELKDFLDEPEPQGPFVHLISEVHFQFAEPEKKAGGEQAAARGPNSPQPVVRQVVPRSKRTVLAFELRPFVDDGKHWVLYTDGDCQRVEIDADLINTEQVNIRPLITQGQAKLAAHRPTQPYRVVLIANEPLSGPLQLSAYNQVLDRT
ncbi:MAG: hypothetical protein MI861_03580, partial [Pirellulales bacterium]|nr:hypothetical protein [Pirellulales bacterium]